jgi:hypothetical protein
MLSKEALNKNTVGYGLLSKNNLLNYSIYGPAYEKYLYLLGDECSSLTGGWVEGESLVQGTGTAVQTKETDHLHIVATGAVSNVGRRTWVTNNAIDLTNISTLKVSWEVPVNGHQIVFSAGVSKMTIATSDAVVLNSSPTNAFARKTDSINVSNLSGLYYIKISAQDSTTTVAKTELNIYEIWGEQ